MTPMPPGALASPSNARIKSTARLRDRRGRDETGLTLVDGAREVRRALEANADVVEAFVCEPLLAGSSRSPGEVRDDIAELLRRVGLPEHAADRYPAQFSGGQRQRIAIARAVAREPKLIICDEPTSALDVTTQASALSLLAELQSTLGCAYLFITHDLAVVKEFADRTLVLQHGRIVEEGNSVDVCDRPRHEYTRRLVAAAPVPDPDLQRQRREQRSLQLSSGS